MDLNKLIKKGLDRYQLKTGKDTSELKEIIDKQEYKPIILAEHDIEKIKNILEEMHIYWDEIHSITPINDIFDRFKKIYSLSKELSKYPTDSVYKISKHYTTNLKSIMTYKSSVTGILRSDYNKNLEFLFSDIIRFNYESESFKIWELKTKKGKIKRCIKLKEYLLDCFSYYESNNFDWNIYHLKEILLVIDKNIELLN